MISRSVERGVQGVPQVPDPDFSGGPKILGILRVILYKDKTFKKWIWLFFAILVIFT